MSGTVPPTCDKCSDFLKEFFGCGVDSKQTHFKESPFPTSRCPRWHVLQAQHTTAIWDLYIHSDGKLGPGVLEMPTLQVQAFNMILQGRAYQERSDSGK